MPALKCTDLTKEKLKVDSSYDGGVNWIVDQQRNLSVNCNFDPVNEWTWLDNVQKHLV